MKISNPENRSILVIAPQFPSVYQRWMDTYLEQLLAHNFRPHIYSYQLEELPYHQKVDDLKLRECVIDFTIETADALAELLHHPRIVLRMINPFNRIHRIACKVKKEYGVSYIETLSKLARFQQHAKIFEEIDCIHAHEEITGFHFASLSMLMDIPLVLTFHGLPTPGTAQLAAPKRKMLFDQATSVLTCTGFAKNLLAGIGCKTEKVEVVRVGVHLPDFPYSPRELPRDGEPLWILSVGRFHRDKGHGHVILAVRRLIDWGLNVKLNVVGGGRLLGYLQSLVEKMGLQEQVTIREHGSTETLNEIYRQTHCLVLASNASSREKTVENQGVVLQEAQSTGCVAIASNVGGLPEVINHEKDGLLVPQRSSKAITSAILRLIEDEELYAALQQAGRKHVEETMSTAVIGKFMAEFFEDIIENHTQAN